jgi:transposase
LVTLVSPLDNASLITIAVPSLIEEANAHVEYLPPYSPDLNPIESGGAKAPRPARSNRIAQSCARSALSRSGSSLRAWFAHAGYPMAFTPSSK